MANTTALRRLGMTTGKDNITIKCYGKEEVWHDRQAAIAFYYEGMCACDGAERDRYTNIYFDLMAGLDYCRDEEDW